MFGIAVKVAACGCVAVAGLAAVVVAVDAVVAVLAVVPLVVLAPVVPVVGAGVCPNTAMAINETIKQVEMNIDLTTCTVLMISSPFIDSPTSAT